MSVGEGLSTVGSGIGSIFEAKGHRAAAKLYDKSALYEHQAGDLEQVSTQVSLMQSEREIYKTSGATVAAYAGGGLETGFDITASNAQQGALTQALIGAQGQINYIGREVSAQGYEIQAATERAMAKSSLFGGIFKIAGGIVGMASDRRLKENIVPVGAYPNGLPKYEFNYRGEVKRWRGVMADEVQERFPKAVFTMPDGYLAVNYEMLGIAMEPA